MAMEDIGSGDHEEEFILNGFMPLKMKSTEDMGTHDGAHIEWSHVSENEQHIEDMGSHDHSEWSHATENEHHIEDMGSHDHEEKLISNDLMPMLLMMNSTLRRSYHGYQDRLHIKEVPDHKGGDLTLDGLKSVKRNEDPTD